jgi:hypothetical protein
MVTERRPSSLEGGWNLPPEIKVLEALGAIADGRVHLTPDGAKVVSSDGSRQYTVRFDEKGWKVGSTDNGSVFRGYYGYPIVALLMLKGYLPFWKELAEALKGIPWKELNERYKRYWKVERLIFDQLKEKGFDEKEVKDYIKKVLNKLKELKLGKINVGQQTLF